MKDYQVPSSPVELHGEFDQLSANVHCCTSSIYCAPQHSSPELILMFTWMGAELRHVAKYTREFQNFYPGAYLLVITASATDILIGSQSRLSQRTHPALDATARYTVQAQIGGRNPRILAVVFSNGGAYSLVTFAKAFQRPRYGGCRLPVSGLILDSSPDRGNYRRAWAAIGVSEPNLFLKLSLYVFLGSAWAVHHTLKRENRMQRTYRELNDGELICEVPRLYLYSERDEMVHWKDVEDHAGTARRKGMEIKKTRFKNSRHVFHPGVYKSQYWDAVKAFWLAAEKSVNAIEIRLGKVGKF